MVRRFKDWKDQSQSIALSLDAYERLPLTKVVKDRYNNLAASYPLHPQAERNMMIVYDDQNIFAKVLRGEIPSYKIYENEHTFAFLDIMPRSPGHTLVIPKSRARGILDISVDAFAEVARTTKRIAVAAVSAFNADGVIIQQFSEPASGQVVLHMHMHVMPVTEGIDLLPAQTRKEDPKVLEQHAARLIATLNEPQV
jgi:histidine triad (HIT) family protein